MREYDDMREHAWETKKTIKKLQNFNIIKKIFQILKNMQQVITHINKDTRKCQHQNKQIFKKIAMYLQIS